MSTKRWFLMFGAAVLLALLAVGAWNVLIDPFGVFGDPILDWYSYDQTNNPRAAKIAYLQEHHEEYDSYVIGSSSAASYNVEELNRYLDARFYNLFVYGCDTKDYCDFARFVIENYEVKNIVLNLGIKEGAVYDVGRDGLNDQMHALTTGESLLDFYLEYAFCNPRYSLEKLRSYRADTELPQVFDVFLPESGCYDKRIRDVEKIGDPAVYEAAYAGQFTLPFEENGLPYEEECARSVAEIRRMCEEKGIRLIVITSPVYLAQWEAYDPSVMRSFKTAIAEEGEYWDFSFSSISYDSRYFYDSTHFRNAVGTMILAEIFDNDSVWRPEDFGTYVTEENREQYFDALFSGQVSWEEESADVPILTFHHFTDPSTSDMELSPKAFEEKLRWLQEGGYTAVTFDELIDYVYHGGTLPEKPVCLTMDDGYYSNYEFAWPLLEKYGMKATIFPIGVSIGSKKYYKDTEFTLTPHFDRDEGEEMLRSGTVDLQSHTYDMHQWAPYETGDEIRSGVLPLKGEGDAHYMEAMRRDLVMSREQFRELWNHELRVLAYPGGAYCTMSEVLIHQAGIPVTLSTATDRRNILVRGLPQSLYALCRKTVTEDMTREELLSYLEGS